uniref:Uncharacterized protein n=1 Tax=Chrysotila carterae TaxID=13221 RepID=A0A7S4BNA9_CHRCT
MAANPRSGARKPLLLVAFLLCSDVCTAQRPAVRQHRWPWHAPREQAPAPVEVRESTWGEYFTQLYQNALLIDDKIGEAAHEVGEVAEDYVYKNVLGLRIGMDQLRRLGMQWARMALGAWLVFQGGELHTAKLALLVEASLLGSFAFATIRKLCGFSRAPMVVRESIVIALALIGMHVPLPAARSLVRALPALSIGLQAGESARGIVSSTYAVAEQSEEWHERASEFAEDVADDVSDALIAAFRLKAFFGPDKLTTNEREAARWKTAGAILAPTVSVAASLALLRAQPTLEGVLPVPVTAAAVAGAFLFERNLREQIKENMLYLKIFAFKKIPELLRLTAWAIKHGLLPLKKILFTPAMKLFGALNTARRRARDSIHSFATTLIPPLKRVSAKQLGAFLRKIPFVLMNLSGTIVKAIISLAATLLPEEMRRILIKAMKRAEVHLLPFGVALIGVATQMEALSLRQVPALYLTLMNPAKLFENFLKPAVKTALVATKQLLRQRLIPLWHKIVGAYYG